MKLSDISVELNHDKYNKLLIFDSSQMKFFNKNQINELVHSFGLQSALDTSHIFGLLLRSLMLRLSKKYSLFGDGFDEASCREYARKINQFISSAVNLLDYSNESEADSSKNLSDPAEFHDSEKNKYFCYEDLPDGNDEYEANDDDECEANDDKGSNVIVEETEENEEKKGVIGQNNKPLSYFENLHKQ